MRQDSFDYIIVGAGSAGCVLANRLSADPAVRVLLLEAGGRDKHPLIHIPLGVGKLYERDLFDWGYLSEPEPGLNDRRLKLTRGKVLGGSSSVNMMAFTRGHPADFDRWAANGATGWAYRDVLPYFMKSECWAQGGSATRGGDGPIGVEFARFEDPITAMWMEAARERGYTVTEDYNGLQQEGFGRGQYSIRHGRRASTAVAYLRPALRRKNLVLRTGALARRILFEGGRAVGVECTRNKNIHTFRAECEVIVAGGTFNSPQLLMLSGIGPAADLQAHDIRPLVDLPVGHNLQEHFGVRLYWERRERSPFQRAMRFDRMALSMLQAHWFGTGVATTHPSALHAFVRSIPEAAAPDIEFIFRYAPQNAHLWFPGLRAPYADGYGLVPVLLHPQSRGRVRLRSSKHTDPVQICYHALTEPCDVQTLRRGVDLARELGQAAALEAFRGAETAPGAALNTPGQIDEWIRATAVPVHHPVGTCAMGGPGAVVDPHLKVYGVDGLRVVDASVMPDLVSAHVNASVIMIAERSADLILRPDLQSDAQHRSAPGSALHTGSPTRSFSAAPIVSLNQPTKGLPS